MAGNTVEVNIIGKESVSDEIAKVIAALNSLRDKTVKVKLDVDRRAFKKNVDDAVAGYNRNPATRRLNIDVDEKAFRRNVRDAIKDASKDSKINVGVDIDSRRAKRELAQLKALIDGVSVDDIHIDVEVDTGKSIAELAALKAAIDSIDGKTVAVNVVTNAKGLEDIDKATSGRNRKRKIDVDVDISDNGENYLDKLAKLGGNIDKISRKVGKNVSKEFGEGAVNGIAFYEARVKDNVRKLFDVPDSVKNKAVRRAREVSQSIKDTMLGEDFDANVNLHVARGRGFINEVNNSINRERINVRINPILDVDDISKLSLDRHQQAILRVGLQTIIDEDKAKADFKRLQDMTENRRNIIRVRTTLIPDGGLPDFQLPPGIFDSNEVVNRYVRERIHIDSEVVGGADREAIARGFDRFSQRITNFGSTVSRVAERNAVDTDRIGRGWGRALTGLAVAGGVFETFSKGLGTVSSTIGTLMRGVPIIGGIARAIGSLASASGAAGPIAALGGSFVSLAAGLGILGTVGVIGTGAISGLAIAAQVGAGAVTGLASGLTALAGGAIAGGLIAIAAQAEEVQTAFSDMGTHVTDRMKEMTKVIQGPLVSAAGTLRGAFDSMSPSIERMSQGTADLVDHLSGDIPRVAKALGPALEQTFGAGAKHIKEMGDNLPSTVSAIGNFMERMGSPTMMEGTERVWQRMPGLIENVGKAVEGTAGAFVAIDDFMSSDRIEPFRQGMGKFFDEMSSTDWTPATNGIANAMNSFGNFMGSIDGADVAQIGADVSNMFADLGNVATNINLTGGIAAVTGALEDLSSAAEAVSIPMGKIFESFKTDGLAGDVETLAGALKKLSEGDLKGALDTLMNGTEDQRNAAKTMDELSSAMDRVNNARDRFAKSPSGEGPFQELERYSDALKNLENANLSPRIAEGVDSMALSIDKAAERLNSIDLGKVIDSQARTLEILPHINSEGLQQALTDFDIQIAATVKPENLDAALKLKDTILELTPRVDEGALEKFTNAGKALAVSAAVNPEIDEGAVNAALGAIDAVVRASVELDPSAQNTLGSAMEIFARIVPQMDLSGLDGALSGLTSAVQTIGVEVLPKLPPDAGAELSGLLRNSMVEIEAAVVAGDMQGLFDSIQGLSSGLEAIQLKYQLSPEANAAIDKVQAILELVLGEIPPIPPQKGKLSLEIPQLPIVPKLPKIKVPGQLEVDPSKQPPLKPFPSVRTKLIPESGDKFDVPVNPVPQGKGTHFWGKGIDVKAPVELEFPALSKPKTIPPVSVEVQYKETGDFKPKTLPPVDVEVRYKAGSLDLQKTQAIDVTVAYKDPGFKPKTMQAVDVQVAYKDPGFKPKTLQSAEVTVAYKDPGFKPKTMQTAEVAVAYKDPGFKPKTMQTVEVQVAYKDPGFDKVKQMQTQTIDVIPRLMPMPAASLPPIHVPVIPQMQLGPMSIPPITVIIIPVVQGMPSIPPITVQVIPQLQASALSLPPIHVDVIVNPPAVPNISIPPIQVDVQVNVPQIQVPNTTSTHTVNVVIGAFSPPPDSSSTHTINVVVGPYSLPGDSSSTHTINVRVAGDGAAKAKLSFAGLGSGANGMAGLAGMFGAAGATGGADIGASIQRVIERILRQIEQAVDQAYQKLGQEMAQKFNDGFEKGIKNAPAPVNPAIDQLTKDMKKSAPAIAKGARSVQSTLREANNQLAKEELRKNNLIKKAVTLGPKAKDTFGTQTFKFSNSSQKNLEKQAKIQEILAKTSKVAADGVNELAGAQRAVTKKEYKFGGTTYQFAKTNTAKRFSEEQKALDARADYHAEAAKKALKLQKKEGDYNKQFVKELRRGFYSNSKLNPDLAYNAAGSTNRAIEISNATKTEVEAFRDYNRAMEGIDPPDYTKFYDTQNELLDSIEGGGGGGGFSLSASGGGGGGGAVGKGLKGVRQATQRETFYFKSESQRLKESIGDMKDSINQDMGSMNIPDVPPVEIKSEVTPPRVPPPPPTPPAPVTFDSLVKTPPLPIVPTPAPLQIPSNVQQPPPVNVPAPPPINIPVQAPQVPPIQLPTVPRINVPVDANTSGATAALNRIPKNFRVQANVQANASAAQSAVSRLQRSTRSTHTIRVRVTGDKIPKGAGFAGLAGMAGVLNGITTAAGLNPIAAGISSPFNLNNLDGASILSLADALERAMLISWRRLGSDVGSAFNDGLTNDFNPIQAAKDFFERLLNGWGRFRSGATIGIYEDGVLVAQAAAKGIRDGNKYIVKATGEMAGQIEDAIFTIPKKVNTGSLLKNVFDHIDIGGSLGTTSKLSFKVDWKGLADLFNTRITHMSAGFLNEFGQMVVYSVNETVHMQNSFDGGLVGDPERQGKRIIEVLNEYHSSRKTSNALGNSGVT